MMRNTETFMSIAWGICVVAPIGLMLLMVETLFGMIAAAVYLLCMDLKGSAQIRVALYNDMREPIVNWFRTLQRELRSFRR